MGEETSPDNFGRLPIIQLALGSAVVGGILAAVAFLLISRPKSEEDLGAPPSED